MDRNDKNIPKSQMGFINFLVIPLFKEMAKQFPEISGPLQQLESNCEYWKNLEEKKEKDIPNEK